MQEFWAVEWTRITGRGPLAVIRGIEGFDPRSLKLGELVRIDGTIQQVRGVETFAVADPTGMTFCLLVEGP